MHISSLHDKLFKALVRWASKLEKSTGPQNNSLARINFHNPGTDPGFISKGVQTFHGDPKPLKLFCIYGKTVKKPKQPSIL